MQRQQLSFSFALILLAAPVPVVAQEQTNNCATQQRKQFVLTALNAEGTAIDNIHAEHLRLKVGNSPATISDVAFRTDQPLDLAILIDSSLSQEKVLPLSKGIAQTLIRSVAIAGRDRVAVVSFSNKPNNVPVLTSDFAAAAAAIDQITVDIPPGYVGGGVVLTTTRPKTIDLPGSTSLWDVVRSATQTLFGVKAENRRRVMLLITDGHDITSRSNLKSVIEDAIKNDVAVFSIGLPGLNTGLNRDSLNKLSEQTGGVASFPKTKDQPVTLSREFAEVARRLRGSYVIGYCGESTNRDSKIQLEVIDPAIRKSKPVLAYKRY